jgi:hypothetical protein
MRPRAGFGAGIPQIKVQTQAKNLFERASKVYKAKNVASAVIAPSGVSLEVPGGPDWRGPEQGAAPVGGKKYLRGWRRLSGWARAPWAHLGDLSRAYRY